MVGNVVESLPRVLDQPGSFTTIRESGVVTPDQFRRLEERLNQMQTDIHNTNLMMRDLSTLVQRQVQMTALRTKKRSLSETSSPSSYLFPKAGSFADLPDLDASSFAAKESTEVLNAETSSDSSITKQVELSTTSTLTHLSNTLPAKKLSLPLAVPDTTLSAQWLAKIETSLPETPQKVTPTPAKLWPPLPQFVKTIMSLTKVGKPTKTAPSYDPTVSRRFSVSSINMIRAQTFAIRQSENPLGQTDSTVTPEEILSARNLEGEVDRFTLRHDTPYRTVWDLLVILMILLDLVFTPLFLGFRYTAKFLSAYNILELVLFTIDFFVRMFSSYVDEHGNLVSGPANTARHYFSSGWALPDFVSWFPFELFAKSSHSDVIGFLKIFRLVKVSHLAHRLHSAKKAGVVRFILLLGLVLTIAHLLTCYWSWVAVGWRSHLAEGVFVPQSLFDEYTLCWSLVIGCVNASPPVMYTAAELISVACFMLVGNILQASVFGAVAALIASIDENEAAYSKKIITTSERCRFLGIPNELADRIRGYYEHLWRETKSVNTDADAFINELSPALICEVKFQLYRDMIKRIPFLSSKKLSPVVIETLILHLQTVIYMQDDVLIRRGEIGDWMGFIGSKGTVGILDPNSEFIKIMRILRKGEYFGEMALLQHTRRSATIVALTWVQINVLCRQDLDYVKDLYPTQAGILQSEITEYKYRQSGAGLRNTQIRS